MRNPTHVVAGVCAALGLGYLAQVPAGVPEIVAGGMAGLLPNVDYLLPALEGSRLPFFRRLAGRVVAGGITHSAVVVLPLAALLGLAAWATSGRPGMLPAAIGGALSHLLLDLCGRPGVQLFAPLSREWHAVPPWESLRPRREGLFEGLVFAGGLALLAAWALPHVLPYAIRLFQALLGGGQ